MIDPADMPAFAAKIKETEREEIERLVEDAQQQLMKYRMDDPATNGAWELWSVRAKYVLMVQCAPAGKIDADARLVLIGRSMGKSTSPAAPSLATYGIAAVVNRLPKVIPQLWWNDRVNEKLGAVGWYGRFQLCAGKFCVNIRVWRQGGCPKNNPLRSKPVETK